MIPDRSLVLYKGKPAIVQGTTDRIEILLQDGTEVRVRPKDVALLHPGPVKAFSELDDPPGEIAEAWELVLSAGEETATNLKELAELCFGSHTPAAAWAAWRVVAAETYFEGEPDKITALSRGEVERRQGLRQAEAEEKEARSRFLSRARAGRVLEEDTRFVQDIEAVALGRTPRSKLLRDLERPDSAEGAHGLLLDLGCWKPTRNPYPARVRAETELPDLPWKPVWFTDTRRDLTDMAAFAIDDEGTTTPDDAVSFHDGRVWVHIADPACAIEADSEVDREARRRGETLHLPERTVHMLPTAAIQDLGLGIPEVSPAISICLEMDDTRNARAVEVVSSRVHVSRLTYAEAEERIGTRPLSDVMEAVSAFRRAREARGAFTLELPETRITVDAGRVSVAPLGRPSSRLMVQEAMVMTGQAMARWAAERGLAVPFSLQEGSATVTELAAAGGKASLSQLWAARRTLRRSVRSLAPGRHAGLGLEPYCQATSPLRRYLDLVVHRQIRAALTGGEPLPPDEVTRCIGEVEAVMPSLRQAETLSERHWTLVYLMQNPGWTGEGVVLDQRGRNHTVVIPSLALETEVNTRKPVEPDGVVRLKIQEIRLPLLEAHFSVL